VIKVKKINTASKVELDRYIRIPFKIFHNCSQWVPPIIIDRKAQLNKNKHPFYEHSDADFFIASRKGEDVGCLPEHYSKEFMIGHGNEH